MTTYYFPTKATLYIWITDIPALVEKLTARCTDVVGTMQSNRKEFPSSVKLAKLNKGETHLIDMAMMNAFSLFKINGGKFSRTEFVITLGEKLIEKYGREPNRVVGRPPTEKHFTDFVPKEEFPHKKMRCLLEDRSTKRDKRINEQKDILHIKRRKIGNFNKCVPYHNTESIP
ncbi:hypothetical protein J437_LFUL019078 [Ladona fulva]|uniref:Uncharacterized protein n=1 Tax=Ladona fulva TaxID=123851 RepID=A0A8K0KRZ9_LADFU|nr:hypothetical protein J437_LFUL019078 [Ladona fulva]